jgi:undecaprenyl-diphosphatase
MPTELSFIRVVQASLSSVSLSWLAMVCARYLIFAFPAFALFLTKGGPIASLASRLTQRVAAEAALAAALAFGITVFVGTLIGRVRPFRASSKVMLLIDEPLTRFSLPSGHAAVAFALAAAIAYANPKWGLLAFAVASLVAFGRVASGVHYPTDVAAGAVLGMVVWFLLHTLLHQLKFV